MNSIINIFKFDYYSVKTPYSKIFLIYFISILLGLLTMPVIPVILIMVFCVSFSGLPFSIMEKNNCEKLYGILPIHRIKVITGRYLFGLISGIINLIISVIIVFIIAKISKQQIDTYTLFISITLGFFYYSFSVSVSYPVYYKISFSKSYLFIMMPLYLLILIVVFLSERTNFIENISKISEYFSNHYILLFLYGSILSIIMLITSAMISYGIFKNKEL